MKTICPCIVLCFLTFALPMFAEDAPKKAPVPDNNAQAEASRLIKEVYGDEYAKAKTATEKQALAKKLLGKADETKDDPASRFVLLKLARDIATQAADSAAAFEAIDTIAGSFQADPLEMKATVLTKFASVAKTPAQHKSISEQALRLSGEAVSQDNFTIADQFGELALGEARKAREKDLITQAQSQIDEAEKAAKAYEEVKVTKATLEKTPDDPAANLVVGKYLCFVKRDWDKGLSMLALGEDEVLKKLAKKELEGAASSVEQAKLGDGWWGLAEKVEGAAKKQMKARAAYWYQQALPGLSGLMKDKVDKRLNEIGKMMEVGKTMDKGSVPTTSYDLLAHIDLERDGVEGTWTQTSKGLAYIARQRCYGRILLPIKVLGDYDLQVAFVRGQGGPGRDVGVIIPVGSNHCLLDMDAMRGTSTGLHTVDGQDGSHNSTTIHSRLLADGRPYLLLIRVRLQGTDASVKVFLDKKLIIQWQGKPSSLGISKAWDVSQAEQPGLAAGESSVTFQSAQLRLVNGKATLVAEK